MGFKEKIKQIWNALFVPTSIEPFKFVLLLENVLSIYRNLKFYKKKSRVLIYLRVGIEIAYSIASIVSSLTIIVPVSTTINIIYYYMNLVISIVIMLLALHFSEKFSKLLMVIESNHTFFANDEVYRKNVKKRDTVIKYGFVISNILVLFIYVSYLVPNDVEVKFLFVLNARVSNCRCIYEHVVLYSVLYVISAQVECITRAISKKKAFIVLITDDNEPRSEVKQFEELYTVFSNIKQCSDLFNEIFGLQLILLLASATIYCIMFLYTTTFLSVKGYHDLPSILGSIARLIISFLLLLLVSWGAQQKQNNVSDLRRQLGNILIDCENNEAHYKATKGFMRLVSTRSIRTKTFGSIDVDMTLIPSFIMFVTSYTVIALQFNNVV